MRQKVSLVEINVYDSMAPLVSGYLQSYACVDEHIRTTYQFEKLTTTRLTPASEIAKHLSAQKADLYAFSSYLWNIGMVKSIVGTLQQSNPDAKILLGGPQVMHHGEEYLSPQHENVMVCNGEGEKTFANLLRQLSDEQPDLSAVRGLSFFSDGILNKTEDEERIRDLDEIPSPYLTGLMDGSYDIAVIETNRGCPFHCGFCFWGAATNDKVIKSSEDRVLDDISWITSNDIPFLYIADANWGILKRDIEISKHIAACKRKSGLPVFVYFSAAKNSPKRVSEIAEIFAGEKVISAQPISMQSLSDKTLEQVERKNIKLSAYEELQAGLNQNGISSFIEMIWPLPGETLESFKKGLGELCRKEASHIVTYPHLVLHNTPIYDERKRHEIRSRMIDDGAAEAEIVIATADVTEDEFVDGMRFVYCILALYNTKILRASSRYLYESGTTSYDDLYSAFVAHSLGHPDNSFVSFRERSIADASYYDIFNYPTVYFLIGHEIRQEFDELIWAFASGQSWWSDRNARFLFEIDMLVKPYLYSNTPVEVPSEKYELTRIVNSADRQIIIDVPEEFIPLLESSFGVSATNANGNGHARLRLDHNQGQRPYSPRQSKQHNADYCNGAIMHIDNVMPSWSAT